MISIILLKIKIYNKIMDLKNSRRAPRELRSTDVGVGIEIKK